MNKKGWPVLAVVGLATAVAFLPPSSGQQGLAFLLLWVAPILFVVAAVGREGEGRLKPQAGRLKPRLRLQSRPSPTGETGEPSPTGETGELRLQSRHFGRLSAGSSPTGELVGEWENWIIAAGLVLLIQPVLALLIHYLPGPIPTWALLLAATLVVLFPLLTFRPSPPGLRLSVPVLLPLLLALLLRLPNMGYKEIQGDEGVILVRAAAALTGDEAELFLHQKGPMEILLPLVAWGVTGATTDFWARLPFLWAGLLGVAAVMLLARRWFNGRIALIAGLLMAIMGFGIAFSRIIQYQTLVMLWGMLALLAATRYRDEGRPLELYLAAVFLAGSLLAHYDAVLVGPALLWVLLKRGRGDWEIGDWRLGDWRLEMGRLGDWVGAGILGAGVLGLFYVPFALNPNFGRTVRYLLNDRVGAEDGLAGWSGSAVWQMMTFYNSTYYIVGLIGLLLVGVWVLWRRREGAPAVLTCLIPAVFYIFVVSDPRTHVYTLFPGAVILAAVGADGLGNRLRRYPRAYGAFLVVGLGWVVVSTYYVYLMFVDVTPERQRTWAENRPSFYATTWDEPPLYGLFGFPHQAGWRMVSTMLGNDFGTYASNEEEEITNWYMRQAPRSHCPFFDKFVWAANAQDEVPTDPGWLQHLEAEVVVNGRVALQIYGREAAAEVERVVADGRQRWLTPQDAAPPTYGGKHPVNVVLGEQVRLLGYDLDSSQAHPGGQLLVTLYWQPLVPLLRNYQVFAHLYDGRMRGQHDGAPECALNPTTRWEPGQIIPDPHLIPIADDAEPGPVPLLVGMYDLLDQQRLAVPESPDNALYLTDVFLEAP